MTPDELRRLLQQPEGEQLEFKRGLPEAKQLAALVAAFANTRGGTLVLGADEHEPERGGLTHPDVAADHARQWIEELVTPTPSFSTEVVSLEPGRMFTVVTIEPGSERPYMVDGRVLERRGDRLVPITPKRITEGLSATSTEAVAIERMAVAIATSAQLVERLEAQLHWRRQLPLQLALVVGGAVIGYLLAIWNPLG